MADHNAAGPSRTGPQLPTEPAADPAPERRSRTYEVMARVRAVESLQSELWDRGLVSGELHTGVGEEAVAAGVVGQLRDGDAMALDHRATGPLVVRGVDPAALLRETLGLENGLCHGMGGHMHLFAPDVLAASDGIVGSSGPTACGLALAGRHRRPGTVAVAFFGEGATNAGPLLESWNLAVAWNLPVLFVCKDNGWAITTRRRDVTGGHLVRRARSFGLRVRSVDGWRVEAVTAAAGTLLDAARAGRGPGLLHARVRRPDGHFLGDAMLRVLTDPVAQMKTLAPGLWSSARTSGGAPLRGRAGAATHLGGRFAALAADRAFRRRDPLAHARRRLPPEVADMVDARVAEEVAALTADLEAELSAGPVGGAR